MKRRTFGLACAAALAVLWYGSAQAQHTPRSTGLVVRGSFWDMNEGPDHIRIIDRPHYHAVEGGGAGGWLTLLSRTSDYWFMEFSLGGISREIASVSRIDGQDTQVMTVVPVLLGMRFYPLPAQNRSNLRPYLAAGGGPYWFADVFVREEYFHDEEVNVDTELKPGGYLGGGLDFMLTSWLGLNFDAKYHFVDFNANSDFSGYECGFGLQFMWGKHRPARRD